jgi:5-methyltetrahydropteroyltriglutamate--homocysteine methyltransferase
MHVCWGNYEGPHHHDVPLARLLPIVLKARAQGLLFEAANPRHAHEWAVFKDVRVPEDKVLIPGVVATTTNYIEHPELVAQRICQYADIVGRERVIAGTDCGFATFVGHAGRVDPEIAYRKLAALVEGAKLASVKLWH